MKIETSLPDVCTHVYQNKRKKFILAYVYTSPHIPK